LRLAHVRVVDYDCLGLVCIIHFDGIYLSLRVDSVFLSLALAAAAAVGNKGEGNAAAAARQDD